jgi:hypothetical protein
MVRPRALAVFKLTTRSNFVGCSIGRSAGFAPFRILSTWVAARRYGSRRSGPVYSVDVRVVAATNRNLEAILRTDLYYRLAVLELYVPPLRDRREEIRCLADYFLERFNAEYRRQVKLPPRHHPDSAESAEPRALSGCKG